MLVEKSFKHKGQYLRKGQRVELEDEDRVRLERKGFISNISTQLPPVRPQNKPEPVKEVEGRGKVVEREEVDYTAFTKAELKVMLDNQNIEYLEGDTKQELIDKLVG